MTYKTYIQNKIRTYNFAEAKFETLPPEVFSVNPNTLSSMERTILEGIIYQKNISKYIERYQTTNQYITNRVQDLRSMIYELNFKTQEFLDLKSYIVNRFSRFAFAGITYTIVGFLLLSATYYANINLNLGMDFLTEFFA